MVHRRSAGHYCCCTVNATKTVGNTVKFFLWKCHFLTLLLKDLAIKVALEFTDLKKTVPGVSIYNARY